MYVGPVRRRTDREQADRGDRPARGSATAIMQRLHCGCRNELPPRREAVAGLLRRRRRSSVRVAAAPCAAGAAAWRRRLRVGLALGPADVQPPRDAMPWLSPRCFRCIRRAVLESDLEEIAVAAPARAGRARASSLPSCVGVARAPATARFARPPAASRIARGCAAPACARRAAPAPPMRRSDDQDHARSMPAPASVAALEGGEIHHAVEVAAHVRHAAEPGCVSGTGTIAGTGITSLTWCSATNQLLGADLEAEPRRRASRGGAVAAARRRTAGIRAGCPACHLVRVSSGSA